MDDKELKYKEHDTHVRNMELGIVYVNKLIPEEKVVIEDKAMTYDDRDIEWFYSKLKLCKKGSPSYIRMRRSIRVYKMLKLYIY